MAKAKITRIKASDSKKTEKTTSEEAPVITRKKVVVKDKQLDKTHKKEAKKAEKEAKKLEKTEKKEDKKVFILFRPFCALGRYIRDSWRELRQVRWPNRKATWKMVIAVLVYTALFVVILTLLDMLFQYLFNLILG